METVMTCFNILFYNLAREMRRILEARMYRLADKDSKSYPPKHRVTALTTVRILLKLEAWIRIILNDWSRVDAPELSL
jgi:hypothetical protein